MQYGHPQSLVIKTTETNPHNPEARSKAYLLIFENSVPQKTIYTTIHDIAFEQVIIPAAKLTS